MSHKAPVDATRDAPVFFNPVTIDTSRFVQKVIIILIIRLKIMFSWEFPLFISYIALPAFNRNSCNLLLIFIVFTPLCANV